MVLAMRFAVLILFLAGCVLSARADSLWTEDYAAALARAKSEQRFVLLNFSGSDWCGWCKKMDEEIFKRTAFKNFARANLVCVLLDYPTGKTQRPEIRRQNEKLESAFRIEGFPTIILLDPDGKPIARTGYRRGGAESYVTHLKSLLPASPAR